MIRERTATGLTMAMFVSFCVILSALPIPSWLKPLDVFESDRPVQTFVARVLSRPQSVPRPSQGYVAGGGALDVATDDFLGIVEDEADVEASAEANPIEVRSEAEPRPRWTMPDRPRLDHWAPRLGLKAAPVIRNCVEPEQNDTCPRRALDRLFVRLRAVESGAAQAGPVRMIHFGDSLIASDKITDKVRQRLQERFGSAGRGFLMVRKFNRFQRGHRTGAGSGGWVLDVITQAVLQDRFFGYTGASFTAQTARETSRFDRLGGSRFIDVFFLQEPQGGIVDVMADGTVLGQVDSRSSRVKARSEVQRFSIPEAAEQVVLRSRAAGIRVFGVVLEADVPGVVYESIGLPGATSEVWLRPDPDGFHRLLQHRDPALVLHMVGGNDGLMLAKRRARPKEIEASMNRFFDRVEAAVPDADCMVVSPLEAVRAKADGRMIPKPEVLEVMEIQRRVAAERGCAYWSLYESMGGKGSLAKWVRANLMLGDLIHPRSRGSDLLGELMSEAIMQAYDEAELAQLEPL